MMNPYVALAVVVAFVANGFYWNYHGHAAADVEWEAKVAKARAESAKLARESEHAMQQGVNNALRKQNESLGTIADGLRRDLAGLRNRAKRPAGLPKNARATCAGATGAELSGEDAEFLAWESSRADEIRAGLEACYGAIDAVGQ